LDSSFHSLKHQRKPLLSLPAFHQCRIRRFLRLALPSVTGVVTVRLCAASSKAFFPPFAHPKAEAQRRFPFLSLGISGSRATLNSPGFEEVSADPTDAGPLPQVFLSRGGAGEVSRVSESYFAMYGPIANAFFQRNFFPEEPHTIFSMMVDPLKRRISCFPSFFPSWSWRWRGIHHPGSEACAGVYMTKNSLVVQSYE